MIENKSSILHGIESLSTINEIAERQKALLYLIDPNAIYLKEEKGEKSLFYVFRFSSINFLYSATSGVSLTWPIPVFQILSTNHEIYGNYTMEITTDIFKELKIIEREELPLYIGTFVNEEFTNLLKEDGQ